MLTIQHSTEFVSALKNEKDTLQVFTDILKKEEDVLTQGKIDDLDFLASDKARLVEKLKALGEQRSEYLLSQDLSSDSIGMDKWLTNHDHNSQVTALWNEILQLAQVAKQLNHTNGLIISSHLEHNQRAFSALQSAAGNISLYGPNGQPFV